MADSQLLINASSVAREADPPDWTALPTQQSVKRFRYFENAIQQGGASFSCSHSTSDEVTRHGQTQDSVREASRYIQTQLPLERETFFFLFAFLVVSLARRLRQSVSLTGPEETASRELAR